MPTPAELLERLINFVGEVLGSSSLRLEVGPTLIVLGVLLVLLQLVARPISRWQTTDAGGLAAIGRAMALAAEAGTDAVVVLGGAGIARSTDSLARLQTLAALPLLGHVARAAARSGVPLRVLVERPAGGRHRRGGPRCRPPSDGHDRAPGRVAHRRLRGGPSGVGRARDDRARAPGGRDSPSAACARTGTLLLEGLRSGGGSLSAGTAEAAQAPTTLLAGGGVLLGAELFTAAADLRADPTERTMVMAANRLLVAALAVLAVGSVLSLAGVIEPDRPAAGDRRSVRRPTVPALVIAVGLLCSPTSSSSIARSATSRGWSSMP